MNERTIELAFEEGIALLRLNRPERRNAMDDVMAAEFSAAVAAVADRSDAKALVITGTGPSFCAGGDLRGFAGWAGVDAAEVAAGLERFYGSFLRILDLPVPTIAAVNGPAVGAGACLAAACDIRIAAASAAIGFTFVRLGISPGMGAEYLLRRLLGPAQAAELLMTGDVLPAAAALQRGLFSRVVPDEKLMPGAFDLARRLGRLPSAVVKTIRANIAAAATAPVGTVLRREAEAQAPTFTDPSFQKQIRKVLEEMSMKNGRQAGVRSGLRR